MLTDVALGAGIAFCIAVFTTPVGASGAVFLVPGADQHPSHAESGRHADEPS